MLAWGNGPDGWMAGVCFPLQMTRGTPLSALLTVWLPAVAFQTPPGAVLPPPLAVSVTLAPGARDVAAAFAPHPTAVQRRPLGTGDAT